MKKSIIKMLIISVVFVIFACNMTVFAAYEDINNHWAKETIEEFEEKSFLLAGEKEFKPDESLTKGELALIVNRFFAYGETDSLDENLSIAQSEGYLSNAKISQNITREEVAVLICKLLSLSDNEDSDVVFMDNEQISVWAKNSVMQLASKGIIVGYPDMTYKPQRNITKAEFVTLLNRCVGIGGNDFEIIDRDIIGIEVGILEYEDEKVLITPIVDEISMNSGDVVTIALMLEEDISEEDIEIKIENEDVISFDKELMIIQALRNGETKIIFEEKNKMYEFSFIVKVN